MSILQTTPPEDFEYQQEAIEAQMMQRVTSALLLPESAAGATTCDWTSVQAARFDPSLLIY